MDEERKAQEPDTPDSDGIDRSAATAALPKASADMIGGFKLIDEIGSGAMGVVHLGMQVALDRMVAIKILPERLAQNNEYVQRFIREAKSAARLDHPNVVRAIDAGEDMGRYYFAMELVEGQSLEKILEDEGALDEERATDIALQAARGLEKAWRNGLVHRDIKPDNLLITYDGVAKIADLGLAKETCTAEDIGLTQDGTALGSPHYISPEQAKAEDVDIRSDIYSLGVTLYRMVTGKLPFVGNDPISTIVARLHSKARPVREVNPKLSSGMAKVVEMMMEADADKRYPDPAVLCHDLELLVAGHDPEYAAGSESTRRSVMEATRSPASTRHSIRTRRSGKTSYLKIAVASAAVLLAGLSAMLIYLLATEGPPAPAPEPEEVVSADIVIEERDRRELDAEALLERVRSHFESERYAHVVEAVEEAGDSFADTPAMIELVRLKSVSADTLAEIAEKEARYQRLLAEAMRGLASGKRREAVKTLELARELRDTPEVSDILAQERRKIYLEDARQAETEGRKADAARLFREALAIQHDEHLAAHVLELDRLLSLARLTAEAREHARARRWADSREAYALAIELATAEEADGLAPGIEVIDHELAFVAAVAESRRASTDGEWFEALAAARRAQGMKPSDPEPPKLILTARRMLGPEPEVADSIGMRFVLIPKGPFTMGSDRGARNERPGREVRLKAYYISKYPVTNAQFEMFDPSRRQRRSKYSPHDETPVVEVTWQEAVFFCAWLTAKEGIVNRLPTEAEWEKASRGTDGREYPWGSEVPGVGAQWRCNIAPGRSERMWEIDGHLYANPVDAYANGVSPFGIWDTIGNVFEWCADWYAPDYYASGGLDSPTGPPAGSERVMRGGSFMDGLDYARCPARMSRPQNHSAPNVGFRVARALEDIFLEQD